MGMFRIAYNGEFELVSDPVLGFEMTNLPSGFQLYNGEDFFIGLIGSGTGRFDCMLAMIETMSEIKILGRASISGSLGKNVPKWFENLINAEMDKPGILKPEPVKMDAGVEILSKRMDRLEDLIRERLG